VTCGAAAVVCAGGINATLLGETSPNRNFEVQANVTYSGTGVTPDASNAVTFQFDMAQPTTTTGTSFAGVSWSCLGFGYVGFFYAEIWRK
jgi:hypothetical protein